MQKQMFSTLRTPNPLHTMGQIGHRSERGLAELVTLEILVFTTNVADSAKPLSDLWAIWPIVCSGFGVLRVPNIVLHFVCLCSVEMFNDQMWFSF